MDRTTQMIALQLTEQEDQISLRRLLVEGVQKTEAVEHVELFELKSDLEDQRDGTAYYRNALDQGAQFEHMERRSTLLQAIAEQQVVKSEIRFEGRESYRYAIPIYSAGIVTEVLSVESKAIPEASFEQIQFLANIYRNYTQLLNKYERDTLTGLLNRRSFEDRLSHYMDELVVQMQAGGEVIFPHLAVLDIDHFKRINDNYGHLYGDDVLLLFSNQMREHFSAETSLYRFGGEEFVVVMNNRAEEAERQLEAFRHVIEHYHFPQVGQVTVSIGYTSITGSAASAEIIDRADQALYFAKEHGRNRVCNYEQLVAMGQIASQQEQDGGDIELF